ncbi:hypothetical protein QQP08_003232 [Theobroma cacao]|nr:hypothetical protein QQP08_003232 [Theobroma cacao]
MYYMPKYPPKRLTSYGCLDIVLSVTLVQCFEVFSRSQSPVLYVLNTLEHSGAGNNKDFDQLETKKTTASIVLGESVRNPMKIYVARLG